ncbi:peptidase [Purpureocillium lavendulum]|uniref:Peptide hydrolase n=1 Tax=Purpureocillium lavendulum TaxID=1247861 RepID=A0AB34G2T2_9HYPO|nr:peptidase [Purpureocillium lavendulum]
MLPPVRASLLLLLSQQQLLPLGPGIVSASASASAIAEQQRVLVGPAAPQQQALRHAVVDPAIVRALDAHADPVDALLALQPGLAAEMAAPRLLHLAGDEKPQWMTEGDKLRLRRRRRKFADVTDFEDFYARQREVGALAADKAHLPELVNQRLVKPLIAQVSTERMRGALERLTGFYTRYFGSTTGEQSAQWIHDQVAEIIRTAPFHTHMSLEYFPHPFPQPSVIARFEARGARNASRPLTVVGAHQDSANYLFPLLPAPGADDDGSGSVAALEALRVLAAAGFAPRRGPVEFHWYAGEEGGNLGSQAVARYKRETGARIGAMLEFDMVAFVARNSTESIGLVETDADEPLTNWTMGLAREYTSLPVEAYKLPPNAGSDYMSFTKVGYPAAFATEGNPMAGGGLPGDYDPYVHGVGDTLDVDDETGHMARFAGLAIAFAVEQAGWDNTWR